MLALSFSLIWLCFTETRLQAAIEPYPITTEDKAFLVQIKNAFSTNDVEWLTHAVDFPLNFGSKKGERHIRNKSELKKLTAVIFSPEIKSIVQNQSPDSLCKNWQGAMIGRGVIWFSQVGEQTTNGLVWTYRIIAINLPGRY